MGTDLPSFLVNDNTIPNLQELPKTPGAGGNGPYPRLHHRRAAHADESSHDDSAQYYSAHSHTNSDSTTPSSHKSYQAASQSTPTSKGSASGSGAGSQSSAKTGPVTNMNSATNAPKSASTTGSGNGSGTGAGPSSGNATGNATESNSNGSSTKIRRQQTIRPASELSSVDVPWNSKDPEEWTNERAIWWLQANGFNSQWVDKFKQLNIHGQQLFMLISYANVKRLGIAESPYRFVKLLRSVVPQLPQQVSSPSRVSPQSGQGSPQNSPNPKSASENQSSYNTSFTATPPKLATSSSESSASSSSAKLASTRRISLEKFLFLDHKLRPRRNTNPGPSILVTRDGSNFQLIGISEVQNGMDVRKLVYEAFFAAPLTEPLSSDRIAVKLTDYFCNPGSPLNDEQIWMVLCAAAGDIVKFHVDAQPPAPNHPAPQPPAPRKVSDSLLNPSKPSNEAVVTPGWSMSSDEPWSSPEVGMQRMYPQTPSYLMGGHGQGAGMSGNRGYFDLQAPPLLPNRGIKPTRKPSSSQRRRSSSASSLGNANTSTEQLVALRAAPKPPLARSLSSKYRPELSPISASAPFSGATESSDTDMWADAPELEDSQDEDEDDDGSIWAKRPAGSQATAGNSDNQTNNETNNSSANDSNTESDTATSTNTRRSSISGDISNKNKTSNDNSEDNTDSRGRDSDTDSVRSTSGSDAVTVTRSGARLPQLVIPNRDTASGTIPEVPEMDELSTPSSSTTSGPMSGGAFNPSSELRPNGGRSGHKATLSESSMESPRSPGAALLEKASIDWASRPPAEVLYENLERFFPNTDLDKPVVVAPKPTPTGSGPYASQFQQLNQQKKQPQAPTTRPPEPPRQDPESIKEQEPSPAGSAQDKPSDLRSVSEGGGKADSTQGADKESGPASIGRAKSIRVVAREASRRLTQQQRNINNAERTNLLRRQSTKMWGQRVVEMRKGTPNSVTLRDHKQYVWVKGELIGRGSFGKVYLGLNVTTGDMMAVKQVKAPMSWVKETNSKQDGAADDSMKALYAEVENMKDLDHLNIVQYLGFERLDRVSNLFLEYVPGGSVKTLLIKFGRFPEDTIKYLNRQVLDGLSYLHSRGILHRDLKADNLLLDIDGTVKISDFGISKRSRDIYTNNAEMSMQGTIFWMAPEVIHNVIKNQKQGYSAKIDVWSLGCVILEMFVGRRPWSTEEAIGAMYKLGSSKQAPPIPEDAQPYVSATGKNFLDCCFVIDPKKRPTAHELLDHSFSEINPSYKFGTTKLGIELKRSVKRTSKLLRTQTQRGH